MIIHDKAEKIWSISNIIPEYGQEGREKPRKIRAGPVERDFFLCNFALTGLENLHHFLNLLDNFWCNAIYDCKYAILLV